MLDISYYEKTDEIIAQYTCCLLYTSPSPRDRTRVWQAFMKIFLLRQKENM